MGFGLTEEEREELSAFETVQDSDIGEATDSEESELSRLKMERGEKEFEYASSFADRSPEDFDLDDAVDSERDNEFKTKYSSQLPTTVSYDDDEVISSISNDVPKVSDFFKMMADSGKLSPEKAKAFGDNADAILGLINNIGNETNEIKKNWLVRNIVRPFAKGSEGTTQRNHFAFAAMHGDKEAEEEVGRIDRSFADVSSGEGIEFGIRSVSKIIGQMSQTARRNIGYIASGALAGATKSFVLGQLGPQALAPEELVTVPAGALIGAGIGYGASSAFDTFRMEAGGTWYELKDSVDDNGKKLDKDVLRGVSYGVGLLNAGMDQIGLHKLMDVLKLTGGKTLSRELINKSVQSALKSPAFRKSVGLIAKKHAFGTAVETITEMGQEITPLIAKYALTDKEFDIHEILRVTGEVGLETLVSTGLLGIPSSMFNVASNLDTVNARNKAITELDSAYESVINEMSEYDRRVMAGRVEELYGETVNPTSLKDGKGNISDQVRSEIDEIISEGAQVQEEAFIKREAHLDQLELQLEKESELKDIQTQIKEAHKSALESKDKGKRREMLALEVDLKNQLSELEASGKIAEEQTLEADEIEEAEAQLDIEKMEEEEAHFQDLVDKVKEETETVTEEDVTRLDAIEERLGVPKGLIEGSEYKTIQADIIREIAREENISEDAATLEYLKHDSQQFSKEHSIDGLRSVEFDVAAEGVGSTFDSNGNNLSGTANFAVAIDNNLTHEVKGKLTKENAEKEITAYREKHKKLLDSDSALTVGTWFNEEDGTTYIDISKIIPKSQRAEAIKLGKDLDQISIFDLETFEEISTGGSGKAVGTEVKAEVTTTSQELAESIQELKTPEELKKQAKRETKPKERAKGFKEAAEGKDTRPVTKTVSKTIKDTMAFLQSQSAKIASGVRAELQEMQRELARITRETLPTVLRGKIIGKMNSIIKIKDPILRQEKFNEAVVFINKELEIFNRKNAIKSLKVTVNKLISSQKVLTQKHKKEGFGTGETANISGKVVDLRAEATLAGRKLSKTKDKSEQAKLKLKISRINKEAVLLEAFGSITKVTDNPNNSIREQLSQLIAVSDARIRKIEKVQEEFATGKIESIPKSIQRDIEAIASGKINIDQLSTKDAQQLELKLNALAEGKKAVASYLHNENKQQARARLTIALQELTSNNDTTIQRGTKKDVKGGFFAGIKAYVRRPALMLQELFGGSDTVSYGNTYGKVTQASNNSQLISASFNQSKAKIFNKINEKLIGKGMDFFDAITKPFVKINKKNHTRNEVMELYALAQSPDGQRVLGNTGYKTDPKIYADMLGSDYKKAVDEYLDFLSSEMYDTLNVEYKRQHGVDMPRVDGKYFPLMSLDAAYKGEALSLEDFGGEYIMPHLNDGMTHNRVNHNYSLGSLDFFGKTSLYEKRAARFAGEAELLSQVKQLMSSKEFQNTVNSVNKHYGTSLNLWLKQVIAGEQFEKTTHDVLWDSIFTLKSNFVRSVLPTRLSVIAKQIPSFFGGTPQLTAKGFADAGVAFANPSAINDFVDGKSIMMRNRAESSMQRLSENVKLNKSGETLIEGEARRLAKKGLHIARNTSDAFFTHGIGAVDKFVTNSLWYGKYKDEIRAGVSEEKAIKTADALINETQPNFQNKDLSQMNRNRFVSVFKMFTSQIDQNLNRVIDVFVGKKMGLSKAERGTRAQGVIQSTVLISMTSLLFRWAKGFYDDDEEDPEFQVGPWEYISENFEKQFVSDLSHGVFGGLPVINTPIDILAQTTYNALTDGSASFYEYRTALQGTMKAPVGQVIDDVLQAYNHKVAGRDEQALTAMSHAIEKATGNPYSGAKTSFKQVGGFLKYLKSLLTDGDHRKQELNEIDF